MNGKGISARVTDTTPAHLPAIEHIEKLCFSVPWTLAQLESQLNADSGIFLVAENEKGDILGYIGCGVVLDEVYISNIAVSPDCRRKGVGDALINALVLRAKDKGIAFLTLEVREGNTSAISLYEKHGFSRVGLRPGYYEKPKEAAVLMTRFL